MNISKFIKLFCVASFLLIGILFNYYNRSEAADDCTIKSAKWYPSGEQSDAFYVDGVSTANINVESINCTNKQLELTIYESDGMTNITDDVWNDSGLDHKSITIPSDNFSMKLLLGEEDCETALGGGVQNDCDLYFKFGNYDSYDFPNGMLYYECDGACDEDAKFLSITKQGTEDDPVNLEAGNDVKRLPTKVYKLLAPFGGITCVGNDPECKIKDNIGDYFNVIFKIAIGLCAALAVIMIVIAGVQYMGDESVFGKTQAKDQMFKAILGLIIALGSYALLNTINPDLLGGGGVKVNAVNAEIEEETEPLTSNDPFNSGQKTEKCTTGVVHASTINGNIPVCSTLKSNVENLVQDAKKSGNDIFGYGYRSKKRQEQLRAQNCGGASNIYNANATCKPLTAYPGKSMHENGLAIDFTCSGKTIKSRDNKCFIWLTKYASKYGFKNLQKEPWHWSTTGN